MTVSLIDLPCHSLTKWLQGFLRPLTANSPYSIENSAIFLDAIKHITASLNECMVSFDLVSLFTSIPLDMERKAIRDLLAETPLSVATDSLMDFLLKRKVLPISLRHAHGISNLWAHSDGCP